MKWVRRASCGVVGAVLLLMASVPFTMPAAAAYMCPSCYGFEQIAQGVYAERDRAHPGLLTTLDASEARVRAAFGIDSIPPVTLLACDSGECDRRTGGKGAKARAFGARFIVAAPGGRSETILSHELAHIVLHDRISALDLLRGDLPAWKNEGIAVLVSGDTRYFELEGDSYSCRVEPDGPLPGTPAAWGKAMRPDTHLTLYAQAACVVLRTYGPPPYDLETILQGHG